MGSSSSMPAVEEKEEGDLVRQPLSAKCFLQVGFRFIKCPFFPCILKAILFELGKSLGTGMRNELKKKLISN